jgi:hypothetical protein
MGGAATLKAGAAAGRVRPCARAEVDLVAEFLDGVSSPYTLNEEKMGKVK